MILRSVHHALYHWSYGFITAAYSWANRARNAAHMTNDLAGMASDVLFAARRFGFGRKLNLHPAYSIDDPKLATAANSVCTHLVKPSPFISSVAADQMKNGFNPRLEPTRTRP